MITLREPLLSQASPALRLLLNCGAMGAPPEWEGAPEWDVFLALVRHHRLGPQVVRALSGQPEVPPHITRALTHEARTAALRELTQAAELARVATVLTTAGVPLLALKGPVEALLCRGALGRRPAVDVDVFIPPDAVDHAMYALGQAGWRTGPADSGPGGPRRARRDNHFGLHRGTCGPRVEVHWRFLRIHADYPLTVDEALAIAEPLTLAGCVVRTLPLVPRVLYLCAHGSHHCWDQVSRLLDIALYLSRGLPPEVGQDAARMGLERPLLLAVSLAHHLLRAPVPAWLDQARAPGRAVVRLAARAVARWDTPISPPGGGFARWDRLSYALALHQNGADRLAALTERLWRKLAPGPAPGPTPPARPPSDPTSYGERAG